MKKIRFIEDTWIRNDQSIKQSSVIGKIHKGKLIDVVGDAEPGLKHSDTVNGKTVTSDLWFQCKNDWYYWAGGSVDAKDSKFNDFKVWEIHPRHNFRDRLQVVEDKREVFENWLETGGAGVKVGIIDSGLNIKHQNLAYFFDEHLEQLYNFTSSQAEYPNVVSGVKQTHGTICSLLIAGRPLGNAKFIGSAPFANLFFFKVVDDNTGIPGTQNIVNALEKAVQLELDIVTISAGQPTLDMSPEAKEQADDVLEKAKSKDITVVVAARENSNSVLSFLAESQNTITVDTSYGNLDAKFPEAIDFILHPIGRKMDFPKELRKSWMTEFSSSFATPLITSTLANYFSFKGGQGQGFKIPLNEAKERLNEVFYSKSNLSSKLKKAKSIHSHSIFMTKNKA